MSDTVTLTLDPNLGTLLPPTETVRPLESLTLRDTEVAGGKGANLGELTRAGIPVPPGFVVTTSAFNRFLEAGGLRQPFLERLGDLDVDDEPLLQKTAEELQRKVRSAPVPQKIRDEVCAAYTALGREAGGDPASVAVRSSATVEDMPGTSFAGMNESFLDVSGEEPLLEAVRDCWASLYGARVIFYRRKQGIPEEKIAIAVIVQRMIDSESAGVMFTVHPTTQDTKTLVIEGAFGLGDTVVGGSVSPDHWELDTKTLEITGERIAAKHVMTFKDPEGRHRERHLTGEESNRPCLTHDQVTRIAQLGLRIEGHYGSPQDIEWAMEHDLVYIVQSRPVTALGPEADSAVRPPHREALVRGLGASPGLRSGIARVLKGLEESERLGAGQVLVARKTEPDWTPLMKRACAIVTDEGGMTAHAAIVSRELGIPCVVGTGDATERIRDGETVTVDAKGGVVYRGELPPEGKPAESALTTSAPARPSPPVTATRLYVNLAQADQIETVSRADVDGVGLLRIEFMVQSVTGNVHPRRLLSEGRGAEFRDGLAERLAAFARAFAPRPVVARTTDFRTNEYRHMEGGEAFEPEEANPMIGYRGVARYVREPDLFRLELEAFRKVREEEGLKNLVLMLPFVRTLSELRACRRLMDEAGLTDDPAFPFWVMAEVPSILYRLDDYVKEGVNGVSIGSNDLTQLMLGVDRDSGTLAPLFDERDPAVMGAIRDIIGACRRLGIPCSICGQAPSVYPELAEKLVEWGITSVSVNPDVIDTTRRILAGAEQRVLLNACR